LSHGFMALCDHNVMLSCDCAMKPWVILLAGLITATAQAAGDDGFYENQCHDAAAWSKTR